MNAARDLSVAPDQRAVFDEELKQLLLSVDDANTRKFFELLTTRVNKNYSDNTDKIDKRMVFCSDLNEQLRVQEKYSRKDSLVILNPPFAAEKHKNLLFDLNAKNTLNVDVIDSDMKGHHVLPTRVELPDG